MAGRRRRGRGWAAAAMIRDKGAKTRRRRRRRGGGGGGTGTGSGGGDDGEVMEGQAQGGRGPWVGDDGLWVGGRVAWLVRLDSATYGARSENKKRWGVFAKTTAELIKMERRE